MDAVAGSAVGNRLGAFAGCETVVAIRIGWHNICGQVVALRQALLAVAAATGDCRNPRSVHQRSRLIRRQDEMFPVAVGADGSIRDAGLHRLAVNTFQVSFGNVGVTLAAGRWNIPVIDFGAGVARWKNAVTAVTIGTAGGILVTAGYCESMNTFAIEFDGAGEGNIVAAQKARIAVTGGAGVGKILFRDP